MRALVTVIVLLAAGCASATSRREADALDAYLEGEFEELLVMSPELATQLGRKDGYDRLSDRSEAGELERLEWRRESVAEMGARFDPETLPPDARISYEIWATALARDELAYRFRRNDFVFTRGGPHTSIPTFLINNHRVESVSDMEAYIARLSALGAAIDQSLARAEAAAAEGIRAPRFAYERSLTEARNLLEGRPFAETQESSTLLADAQGKIDGLLEAGRIDRAEADALVAGAERALLEDVGPAYERLITWLEADIADAPSGVVGALTYPNGEAWYEAALYLNTTTDMTAEEIHALGLAEVERIQAEMEAVKDEVGFEGSLAELFVFMRSDDMFLLPDTDEGRQAYIDLAQGYLDAMDAALPQYFGVLPEAELVVRRVEPFREEPGGAQHYRAPTPDGSLPGIFYAHLSDMSAMPTFQLEAIAYHEGAPGHHLQIAIARELTGVPTFRTVTGYAAYSEGWGLYAEELAAIMGFYEDPYSEFGRLSTELWRAVRLVVDTGIHAKGWSEEEAVEYFLANAPSAEGAVRSEIRRYIVTPGQATSYKIGMITIQRLRAEAMAALGPDFDYRDFHDVILGAGAMPLPVLEARVRRWIAAGGGSPS